MCVCVCVCVCTTIHVYAHCMRPAHSALPSIGPDSSGPPCSGVGGGVEVGEQALKEAPVTHYPTIHPPFASSTPPKHLHPRPSPCPSPSPCPLSSGTDSRHTAPRTHSHTRRPLTEEKRFCFSGTVDRTAVKGSSVCV